MGLKWPRSRDPSPPSSRSLNRNRPVDMAEKQPTGSTAAGLTPAFDVAVDQGTSVLIINELKARGIPRVFSWAPDPYVVVRSGAGGPGGPLESRGLHLKGTTEPDWGRAAHQFGPHPIIDAPGQGHDSIFIQVWTMRLLGAPIQLGSTGPYPVGDFFPSAPPPPEAGASKAAPAPGHLKLKPTAASPRSVVDLPLHDAHGSLAGSVSFTVSAYGWRGATAPSAAASTAAALPPAATPALVAPRAVFHTTGADGASDPHSTALADAADAAAFRGAPNCLVLLVERAWLPARATNAFVEVKVRERMRQRRVGVAGWPAGKRPTPNSPILPPSHHRSSGRRDVSDHERPQPRRCRCRCHCRCTRRRRGVCGGGRGGSGGRQQQQRHEHCLPPGGLGLPCVTRRDGGALHCAAQWLPGPRQDQARRAAFPGAAAYVCEPEDCNAPTLFPPALRSSFLRRQLRCRPGVRQQQRQQQQQQRRAQPSSSSAAGSGHWRSRHSLSREVLSLPSAGAGSTSRSTTPRRSRGRASACPRRLCASRLTAALWGLAPTSLRWIPSPTDLRAR